MMSSLVHRLIGLVAAKRPRHGNSRPGMMCIRLARCLGYTAYSDAPDGAIRLLVQGLARNPH